MKLLAVCTSFLCLGLLTVPGSPAAIDTESWYALLVWGILGAVFYTTKHSKLKVMTTTSLADVAAERARGLSTAPAPAPRTDAEELERRAQRAAAQEAELAKAIEAARSTLDEATRARADAESTEADAEADGSKGKIAVIGPTRMDYEKILSTMLSLNDRIRDILK